MIALRLIKKKSWRLKVAKLTDVSLKNRLLSVLSLLLVLSSLHITAMMLLEQMSFQQALWLTITTLTTVGYGDLSASTPAGQYATIILLYFAGISLLALAVGDYVDYRLERRQKMLKGLWRWNMNDHIVIINTPQHNGERYLDLMITQLRQTEEFEDKPIQILSSAFPDGLPHSLRDMGVVHFHGSPDSHSNLDMVNIKDASHVIILAKDEYESLSDSLTFDILHRIQESSTPAHVTAECVDDDNRDRFYRNGANSVIRPVRAYPEIVVRALVAPGSEKILENLFTHSGDHTQRYNIQLKQISWSMIASKILHAGFGTALAYIDEAGNVICNPAPEDIIVTHGLIIMVNHERKPTTDCLRKCLV